MIRKYEIKCPVCGHLTSERPIKPGIEQRFENVMCKNGHPFTIDIGYAHYHVFGPQVRYRPDEQRAGVKRFIVAQLRADAIQKEVVDVLDDWAAEPHVYGRESEHDELADYFQAQVDRIREGATS